MSWIDGARARLHLVFARRAAESRVHEEVQFHIEMETDRLVRDEGLALDEARRRALASFGGVTQHTETLRDGRGLGWLAGLSLDVKLALRMLVKHPGLTLVAVVGMSVAVAIGAVTFSAVHAIVDGQLPLSDGDRIVAIRNVDTRGADDGRQTHLHDLAVWREGLRAIDQLGAYRTVDRNFISNDHRSESVRVAEMTASGFRIARVPPLLGRYFHDDDEQSGAPPVAIVGYSVWQTRFSGRRDVVGETMQLGDTRYRIIGVMPEGFAFPVNNRVWTPLRLNPADYEPGRAPGIEVFGRLAPGASIADAQRQATTIAQRLAAATPSTHEHIRTKVFSYARSFVDSPETAWAFHLVQIVVLLLLGVIGTNVAILVYARTAGRMGEIAIRTALGATRSRVVGQLFAEALALSGVAAAIGLLIAQIALENIDAALVRMGGEQLPFWMHFRVSPMVVLYSAGLAIVAAVIVGVVPALKATRGRVRANLQDLSAGGSGLRLGKTWTLLVITQVTVAVAVLPVAIAGVGAWTRIDATASKLAAKQILTATLFLDGSDFTPSSPAAKKSVVGKVASLGAMRADSPTDVSSYAVRAVNLRTELVDRLRAEPGVAGVALASDRPGAEPTSRVDVDGARSETPGQQSGAGSVVSAARIDLRYLALLDIPVLAGRAFTPADVSPRTTAVIVNRSFVQKLLGGANPLGRRVRAAAGRDANERGEVAPWEEIVGVVPDFPVDSTTPEPKIYRPLLPTDPTPVTLVLRLHGADPTTFTNRLRDVTIATNPMLRLDGILPLDRMLYEENAGKRLTILALELVTGSTLLLSAAGIYALMAFTITRRRREIGIRSALGAGSTRLLVSVLSRVGFQVLAGIVIGTGLAASLDHLLEGGWTGRHAAEVLPGVVVSMALVGVISAFRPAMRALRIQPTEALRSE